LTSAEQPRPQRAAPVHVEPHGNEASVVINTETLAHLEELGGSTAFMTKLLGVFIADNTELMTRMEKAVAGRNYPELRSLLHAMKGSSASMGTDRLTAACGTLGRLSDAELRLKGPGLMRSLAEELQSARAELERYVRSRHQSVG